MYASARPTATTIFNKTSAATISQAIRSFDVTPAAALKPCFGCSIAQSPQLSPKRALTTGSHTRADGKEYFPAPAHSEKIRITPPAWHHPIYTEDQMTAIKVAHRDTKQWSDWFALAMMRFFRFGMDTATGYSHPSEEAKKRAWPIGLTKVRSWFGPTPMTERKWMFRFLFLESVAGVPGMVAASVRHLHSLRRMKRDNGWIETLLEEAYNERMHLLTFMKMAEPGRFMKLMILGAQGVFYNGFFLAYLMSPRICHRFVGYLEEEAVLTYTRVIADLDAGRLPGWQNLEAPEIAVKYWNMPESHRTMRDLLLYIRADEAKHREVNHTLGNLEQKVDPNPFISEYEDPSRPHPSKGIENIRPTGWERKEVL